LDRNSQTGKQFTDPRLAIIAIDQDIMRLAHEKIMAMRDWRDKQYVDRLRELRKPRESYSDVILRTAEASEGAE
jgi:hypothetical protein